MQEYLDIGNEIVQIESDETQKILVLSLSPYFKRLRAIKDQIKVHQNIVHTDKNTYYSMEAEDEQSKELLFEAYEIIQQIRYIITGEQLQYHLFIQTKNGIEGIEIGSTDLRSVTSLGRKDKFAILEGEVKKILEKNDNRKIQYLQLFNNHYNQIMNSMSSAKTSGYFIPPKEKRDRYNLYQKDRPTTPAIFNKGHIIESLDAIDHTRRLWQHYFYQNLALDNISGFQGGDNLMIQVKFKDARLMEFITIVNGINDVLNIQALIESGSEKNVIKQAISTMFFAGNAAAQFSANIDKFIEQLERELVQPLEKFAK